MRDLACRLARGHRALAGPSGPFRVGIGARAPRSLRSCRFEARPCRLLLSACLVITAGLWTSGCAGLEDSGTSSAVDGGFGTPTARVDELDEEAIGDVMTTVLLRNRMYTTMRLALPLDVLINGTACHSNVVQTDETYAFETTIACAVPEALSTGQVEGEVILEQAGAADVFIITLEYRNVSVQGASVDGAEHIIEVAGDEGMTEVSLTLEHDGFLFDYTFQMGLLSAGSPAFDYEVASPAGVVYVRLTNPATVGAFATATMSGTDATRTCEIRNAAWSPGDPARGTCDDGSVFGL